MPDPMMMFSRPKPVRVSQAVKTLGFKLWLCTDQRGGIYKILAESQHEARDKLNQMFKLANQERWIVLVQIDGTDETQL